MSIRVLKEAAAGRVYVYHSLVRDDGSTEECLRISRVRRDSGATYLTCEIHDTVTSIPRNDSNSDHRSVEALVVAGKVTPLVHPDNTALDPITAAREDGVAGIPAVAPQDTTGRKALLATLKAAHVNVRP